MEVFLYPRPSLYCTFSYQEMMRSPQLQIKSKGALQLANVNFSQTKSLDILRKNGLKNKKIIFLIFYRLKKVLPPLNIWWALYEISCWLWPCPWRQKKCWCRDLTDPYPLKVWNSEGVFFEEIEKRFNSNFTFPSTHLSSNGTAPLLSRTNC